MSETKIQVPEGMLKAAVKKTIVRVTPQNFSSLGIVLDQGDEREFLNHSWRVEIRNGYSCLLRRTRESWLGKYVVVSFGQHLIGKKPGMVIDHINGNSLDCRRENLRHCTPNQNMWNMKKHSGREGVKGVYKTQCNSWKAEIQANGERFWSFHKSFEAAALARKEMERIHHGEFARA